MTNLNLRRFIVASILFGTGVLCSPAQSRPPTCGPPCVSNAASQMGCNIYKISCFCGDSQFFTLAESCIQESCADSAQDAMNFLRDLCTVSSTATSSSSGSSSTASASNSAAAASIKLDMALMGGVLGALQVFAALT